MLIWIETHPKWSAALLVALCIVAIVVTSQSAPRVAGWVTVASIFLVGRAAIMLRRRRR